MPPRHFKKSYLLIFSSIFLLGVGFIFWNRNESYDVTSFEGCVAEGNPILESYPPQCITKNGKHFTQNIGNELELSDLILIENPRPNQLISSPLRIKGRARGNYFFEGTFPIRLVDGEGVVLSESVAKADGEWMTEEFVSFTAELTFTTDTKTGELFLESANPSGLKENQRTLMVPVTFYENKTTE